MQEEVACRECRGSDGTQTLCTEALVLLEVVGYDKMRHFLDYAFFADPTSC